MINKSTQQSLLQKILASQEFSSSKIYQAYLTYLVKAANEGKSVKEITIAIDVFGKDKDFNPAEDTIVRSHTYTLRKKLDSYYYNEGKEDRYRLEIPKGHYEVQFCPKSEQRLSKGILKKLSPWIVTFIILLVAVYNWQKYLELEAELQRFKQFDVQDPIWKGCKYVFISKSLRPVYSMFFNLYDIPIIFAVVDFLE